jgi:hypothetical protein
MVRCVMSVPKSAVCDLLSGRAGSHPLISTIKSFLSHFLPVGWAKICGICVKSASKSCLNHLFSTTRVHIP